MACTTASSTRMAVGLSLLGLLLGGCGATALPQDSNGEGLKDCGEARYYPSKVCASSSSLQVQYLHIPIVRELSKQS